MLDGTESKTTMIWCIHEILLKHKGTEKFKINGWGEKTNHTNTNNKKACVAMLLSIKVDFKAKKHYQR